MIAGIQGLLAAIGGILVAVAEAGLTAERPALSALTDRILGVGELPAIAGAAATGRAVSEVGLAAVRRHAIAICKAALALECAGARRLAARCRHVGERVAVVGAGAAAAGCAQVGLAAVCSVLVAVFPAAAAARQLALAGVAARLGLGARASRFARAAVGLGIHLSLTAILAVGVAIAPLGLTARDLTAAHRAARARDVCQTAATQVAATAMLEALQICFAAVLRVFVAVPAALFTHQLAAATTAAALGRCVALLSALPAVVGIGLERLTAVGLVALSVTCQTAGGDTAAALTVREGVGHRAVVAALAAARGSREVRLAAVVGLAIAIRKARVAAPCVVRLAIGFTSSATLVDATRRGASSQLAALPRHVRELALAIAAAAVLGTAHADLAAVRSITVAVCIAGLAAHDRAGCVFAPRARDVRAAAACIAATTVGVVIQRLLATVFEPAVAVSMPSIAAHTALAFVANCAAVRRCGTGARAGAAVARTVDRTLAAIGRIGVTVRKARIAGPARALPIRAATGCMVEAASGAAESAVVDRIQRGLAAVVIQAIAIGAIGFAAEDQARALHAHGQRMRSSA